MKVFKVSGRQLYWRCLLGVVCGWLGCFVPSVVADVSFWYEDNNMQRSGGYPEDFEELFRNPDSWKELRANLSVYYIRGSTLRNVRDDLGEDFFIHQFCKLFREEELPVAIDNPGEPKNWGVIDAMIQNGVTVSHIGLQSILSKFGGGRRMTEEQQKAELLSRIESATTKLGDLQQRFPQSKIGIICALPTKGLYYEWAYVELMRQVRAADGRLDFIHVDCPAPALVSGNFISWDDLSGIKYLIQETLGVEYGFVITDGNAGRVSNRAFYDSVMQMARVFPMEDYPDYFIMMSWFPFPKYSVRVENVPDGALTMTRTSLDFVRWVSAKRKVGSGEIIEYRDWTLKWEGREVAVTAVLEKVETGQVFLKEFATGRVGAFRGTSLSAEDQEYVKRVLGLR